MAAPKCLLNDASKAYLSNIVVNGPREGAEFPRVDSKCLNEQCTVTFIGIDIFEQAYAYLKINVTGLQYDKQFEEGKQKDKKGLTNSVRAASIEPVKHWVWLLYKPVSEPNSIRYFFQLYLFVRLKVRVNGTNGEYAIVIQCL